jgi:hypothetical protein
MKEDQMETATTIVWYLDALIRLYAQQTDSISEVLPDEFSVKKVTDRLIAAHLKKAKALIRKHKEKSCDT